MSYRITLALLGAFFVAWWTTPLWTLWPEAKVAEGANTKIVLPQVNEFRMPSPPPLWVDELDQWELIT